MEARWKLKLAMLASLATASTLALSQQEPPPATPPQDAPQDAPKDPAAAEEPEEAEARPLWNWVRLGYTAWDPTGNRYSLRRYGTPPEGFSVRDLYLFTPGGGTTPFARLSMKGMFEQDSLLDGYAIFDNGTTQLKAVRTENQFFNRTLSTVDESRDRGTEITLSRSIAPDVGAFVRFRDDQRDHRHEAPRPADRTYTRSISGGIEGKLLGGHASVTVGDHRFYDSGGSQPTTLQRKLDASYTLDVGDTFSVEGSGSVTKIEQTGRPNGHLRTWAVAGVWDLAPSTGLQFHLARRDVDLDVVQNAYTQKLFTTSLRLVHRLPRWSVQAGFKHTEAERLRGDQSYVDVPVYNTWDGRIAGRLNDQMRLTLKGSWRTLAAGTPQMVTADSRSMTWNDKGAFDARVDGGNDAFNGYAGYSFRFLRNAVRDVEVRWHNFAAGGSYQFSPELLGYVEVANERFQVNGDLDPFFPDSWAVSAGVNWSAGPQDSFAASLGYFTTNNERGYRLTAEYSRQLDAQQSVRVFVAPWRLEDRLYDLTDYRTTLFGVDYTLKF